MNQRCYKNFDLTSHRLNLLSGFVTLTRSFKNESIEIVFNCQDEGDYDDHDETRNDSDEDDDDADEKEEEEEPYGINFKVIITKNGGDKMILQCAAFDRVNINGVRYVPAGSASSDKLLYAGPVFDHLDGELYKAFYSYLADRAIDDDLANFITSYSLEKEQNEYANWLQHLADFTAEEREGIV